MSWEKTFGAPESSFPAPKMPSPESQWDTVKIPQSQAGSIFTLGSSFTFGHSEGRVWIWLSCSGSNFSFGGPCEFEAIPSIASMLFCSPSEFGSFFIDTKASIGASLYGFSRTSLDSVLIGLLSSLFNRFSSLDFGFDFNFSFFDFLFDAIADLGLRGGGWIPSICCLNRENLIRAAWPFVISRLPATLFQSI